MADSATTYARRFIAENAGNVDIHSGAECKVPLFDSQDITSAVLSGINESDRSTVEAMVKNVLLHIGDLQAGTVITRHDPVTLHPGEKIVADAHFKLPPEVEAAEALSRGPSILQHAPCPGYLHNRKLRPKAGHAT